MAPTLSNEELMESPTFKKFVSCMDYVFDTAEEANLATMDISKNFILSTYHLILFNCVLFLNFGFQMFTIAVCEKQLLSYRMWLLWTAVRTVYHQHTP